MFQIRVSHPSTSQGCHDFLSICLLFGFLFDNHVLLSQEDSENTLPNNEVNVGLEASPSGPSVLGDKGSEVCATADPPEIADPHNNRKRHRE